MFYHQNFIDVHKNKQDWLVENAHEQLGTKAILNNIRKQAKSFETCCLQDLDRAALLNRVDTKYVIPSWQLLQLFSTFEQNYFILNVKGKCLNLYRTLYFDDPNFSLYHMHVNGKVERYKVRTREYMDTQLSFLEVKHHTSKDRTIKERMETMQPVYAVTTREKTWLQNIFPYEITVLEPKLWNTFSRITLIGKEKPERVTLDLDITFYAQDRSIHMGNLAIMEVKINDSDKETSIMQSMREQGVHACGFSKYIIGVSLLYEQVKKNAVKPKLLYLDRMLRGFNYEYVH